MIQCYLKCYYIAIYALYLYVTICYNIIYIQFHTLYTIRELYINVIFMH